MKIISLRIFALFFIALFLLVSMDARKKNKNAKNAKNAKAKKLNRLASIFARMISEGSADWENDPFLKELKNENKYLLTANNSNKWVLIKMVIGKTIQLLGIENAVVEAFLKGLSKTQELTLFTLIMKFQKTMNFDDLMPLIDYKVKGLTKNNFLPLKRQTVLNFLNEYVKLS